MKMRLQLNAPGMTSLHKAGLAGLFMTLRAFEETDQKIDGLSWKLESHQIVLEWQHDKPRKAFADLIKKSFRVENGFVGFAGLEVSQPLRIEQRELLNYALRNSFLQFGPENPTGKPRPLSYEVDDHPIFVKDFKPLLRIRSIKAPQDFIGENGDFKSQIIAKSWMYPGGITRHEGYSKATTLEEPLITAIPLLFAPVGVIYYAIKSRARGRKARLAMVVPEIRDLQLYTEIRQILARQGVLELTANGASDAVLRMLTTIQTNSVGNTFASFFGEFFVCRVLTFGIVDWNEKQKSRTYVFSISSGRISGFDNYALAAAIFKNRWQLSSQDKKHESYFVSGCTAREIIAENIASGRPWYGDLATYLTKKDVRKGISFERKELNQMVEEASFDNPRKKRFIDACHRSWRNRMGKLSNRAGMGGGYRRDLIQKEFDKLRSSLLRSRNSQTLRQTVVDLWARAGLNEELQGPGLHELLPMFNEDNWRETRDLALLALISYKPEDPEEIKALATETGNEETSSDE